MNFDLNRFMAIAEIGINHEGDFYQAKRILKLAAESGADCVKFQSYTPTRYAAANDAARLQRVSKMALNVDQFKELATMARDLGVTFFSTPLTEDWVDILNEFCPLFKIASGDITFEPVIRKAAATGKPLIISTGAATLEEIDRAVSWVKDEIGNHELRDRLILMHCVSAYPTPIEEANILSIPFLRERYGLKVGYSNHVMGMNACLGAVALGADIVEVHFTDQKEGREFRDHALSFEKADLQDFIARARDIRKALGAYEKKPMPCELANIPAMRKGIVAAHDLKMGQVLTETDLIYARPATEYAAADLPSLIGKSLNENVAQGHLVPRKAIKGEI